jgi:hypothetical protein
MISNRRTIINKPEKTASQQPSIITESKSNTSLLCNLLITCPDCWYSLKMSGSADFLEVFRSLPSIIYLIVQSYIPKDYKHFINSCKSILRDIKEETIYYNLNQQCSFRYCQDVAFRSLLLSKIKRKQFQISLNFRQFKKFCTYHHVIPSSTVYAHAVGVNKLKFEGIDGLCSLESFSNIEELNLYSLSEVTSTEGLFNISKLCLNNFGALIDINNLVFLQECSLIKCPFLSDISALRNVKTLHLEDCPLVTDLTTIGYHQKCRIILCGNGGLMDISTLGNVTKSLELDNIKFTEFPFIHNIPEIKLSRCHWLTVLSNNDIFPYRKTWIISLESCPNVVTFAPLHDIAIVKIRSMNQALSEDSLTSLTTVKSLSLEATLLYSKLPLLPQLNKLEIRKETGFLNLNNFSHLTSLLVDNCANLQLTNLSCFGNIPYLSLSCVRIPDLIGLGKGNKCVTLTAIDAATRNKQALHTIPELQLINCNLWIIDDYFSFVRSLTIERNSKLKYTGVFAHLYQLTLSYCDVLTVIVKLENVHIVNILFCHNLVDLSGLGNNYAVKLYKCDSVESIEPLRNVKELRISHCKKILSVEGFSNVLRFVK